MVPPGSCGPGDDGEAATRRLVLRDALTKLTPRQRAALSLRFYDDLTEVQTAKVLGCSVSTVKSAVGWIPGLQDWAGLWWWWRRRRSVVRSSA